VLQINAVLHDDYQRVGPLTAARLAVFYVELVADDAAAIDVVKIDGILEDFAVQRADACVSYDSVDFWIVRLRLADKADVVVVIVHVIRVCEAFI